MGNNYINEKCFGLTISIIKECRRISDSTNTMGLCELLLKSSTTMTIKVKEVGFKKDNECIRLKCKRALTSIQETLFWITILNKSGYIQNKKSVQFKNELLQIKNYVENENG